METPKPATMAETYAQLSYRVKGKLLAAYPGSDTDFRRKLQKPTADFETWFWAAYNSEMAALSAPNPSTEGAS